MKICLAMGPWLPVPPIQGGAVERRWQGVAEVLASRGHNVEILCKSYDGQPASEIINGVKYTRRYNFSQSKFVAVNLLKDLIYAVLLLTKIPKTDILVINDFWLPFLSSLIPRRSFKTIANVARFPKGQIFLYSKIDRIIVPSAAMKKAIAAEAKTLLNQTVVVPNPINISKFKYSSPSQNKCGKQIILYVGRVHPEKGLTLLIDAFSSISQKFPSTKLQIVGPHLEYQGGGGPHYLHSLKEKSINLNVDFTGPIFNIDELAQKYQNATVFCYPSIAEKGESFGVAPLEAMSTGLVPIVSSLECFSSFIKDGENGYYFDHRNNYASDDLADKIIKVLENREVAQKMSESAIKTAFEFSYEKVAIQYEKLFFELYSNTTC
ncbi:MAG: glycosyltransferase family 4 protein [Cyanobacteria bacterium P01_H01_bin.21]